MADPKPLRRGKFQYFPGECITNDSLAPSQVKAKASRNFVVPVAVQVDVPNTAGDITITVPRKMRLVHVTGLKGPAAGGAGDEVTIKREANAITNAISLNVAEKTVLDAGTIDPAEHLFAADEDLVITVAKATNCACLLTLTFLPEV